MSSLAERLSLAMDGRKQIDLAKACGVKPPSVNDWLTGKSKRMDGVYLIHACEFLGVRPKWLALGLGPMREQPLNAQETLQQISDLAAMALDTLNRKDHNRARTA